jgi:hypothetical protein
MDCDLPGIYYRPDRGWSAEVRALVGSQFYGDETMAGWALDGVPAVMLPEVALQLAGLVAVLLAHGPWGDGCNTQVELRERWGRATALLVAELESAPPPAPGAPPDPGDYYDGDDG